MAILSADGKSVTVEKGDNLWRIAANYLGSGTKYKQLAAINNISNPDLIYVGQVVKLTNESSSDDGGTTTTTTTKTVEVTQVTINQFGLQSDTDRTVFVTWGWSRENTDHYEIRWWYMCADGVHLLGSESTTKFNHSTYTAPENAERTWVHIKPISTTYTVNDTETSYWTAEWSTAKTYYFADNPPTTPAVPSVSVDKYKLTAELTNLDVNGTSIQFQIVKNDASVFNTGTATIVTNSASYSCTVDAGGKYKVRCRSCRDSLYSNWSDYSENVSTIPSTPSGIITIKASSETSVYLEWSAAETATSYDIEYATKKEYFDASDQTTTKTGIEYTQYDISGLETGEEYFFRVRAVNTNGNSAWSGVKSVVIGKEPAAPTTWSSTTTVITGEELTLYWVHNAEDGSTQTYAEIEIYIDGDSETYMYRDEDGEDKTNSYDIDTSEFIEGTTIQWRVRTAGITKAYGDWSVQRTVDVYAPPTLELGVMDVEGEMIDTLTTFPFYISGLAGPNTQEPIGYYVTVTSNAIYETVDYIGNTKTVNNGEQVYSKYFDISDPLLLEMSASNIDLENNISYTVTCTVSMNSGLTAESSVDFTVAWTDAEYEPNAAISVDEDTLVAYIRPYCRKHTLTNYKVTYDSDADTYTVTTEALGGVWGELLEGVTTTTGEEVYSGVTADDEEIFYAGVITEESVEDITLSVYRREFDGSFTELATELDNSKATFITDPHPSLDYARYRVVAITDATGSVSYYDVPGYPINEKAVIIQWDEEWTSFESTSEDALEQPPWSGSLLKLPYNVDVSNNHSLDVSLIEYIGRKHPVSYYGTQVGETATWNVDIEKSDKDTLYALRRLAKWLGDVYVREPSGSGYWANITVSFSQKHLEKIIPVTLDITRVEGGA